MGLELATWLSTYSAVMAGDLTSVSIGGTPPRRAGLLGGLGTGLGLFGQPQGLSHSHNRFEADVSPTRGDLYITWVECPPPRPARAVVSFANGPGPPAATSTRSTSRTSRSSGTCRRARRATTSR